MEHSFQISTEDGTIDKSMVIDSACHLNMTYDDKTSISNSHKLMLIQSMKKNQKKTKHVVRKEHQFANESFFQQQQRNVEECKTNRSKYKNENYPMLDLTRTLYNTFAYPFILKVLCFISTAVRVYLTFYFFSVLGVTTGLKLSKWYFLIPWIVAVVGSRLLYLILVMKVGLTSPCNHVERILKNIWNRQNIRINEAFEYITYQKFLKCFLKGAIPAELAFIYIPVINHKRSLIYSTINFIYMSIQSIIMFPFVIVYSMYILITQVQGTESFWKYTWITLILVVIWISLFSILCGYLLYKGYKLKYQRLQ